PDGNPVIGVVGNRVAVYARRGRAGHRADDADADAAIAIREVVENQDAGGVLHANPVVPVIVNDAVLDREVVTVALDDDASVGAAPNLEAVDRSAHDARQLEAGALRRTLGVDHHGARALAGELAGDIGDEGQPLRRRPHTPGRHPLAVDAGADD